MHPYPEEINRKIISAICDLHFAPTKQSAENLQKDGVDPKKIYITGNPVIDSLKYISEKDQKTLSRYIPSDILNSRRIILVTSHRRENWGTALRNLCNALKELVKSYSDIQVVYPVHFNPNVRKTVFDILGELKNVCLLDPLPYETFVEIMNYKRGLEGGCKIFEL
jgi:UDP-N-acetylglucosamine 2-epimerase (non-hydrolysing)